jgi:hypothetical protein
MLYEMFILIGQLSLRKSASKIDSKHKTEGPWAWSLFLYIEKLFLSFLIVTFIIGYCKITDCEPLSFVYLMKTYEQS